MVTVEEIEHVSKLMKIDVDDHKILKNYGYDDKQIVEITSVVAAFNWANIIADALGTDMES